MTPHEKAVQLLAQALNAQAFEIDEGTSIETCEMWDSLAHFRVVAVLEKELGRSLKTTEIFEVMDFPSVVALLSANVES